MQERIDRLLGIEPRKKFISLTGYEDNFYSVNQQEDRIKYAIGREYWSVYQQILLFIMAMRREEAFPWELVCIIAKLSFSLALSERIEDAVVNHGWKEIEGEDGSRHLAKGCYSYLWRREYGFPVVLKGQSFYIQDLFLKDDWLRGEGIVCRANDRYNTYRRSAYQEVALVTLYLTFLLIDWLWFDFGLSEHLVKCLYPTLDTTHAFLFTVIFNPLRLVVRENLIRRVLVEGLLVLFNPFALGRIIEMLAISLEILAGAPIDLLLSFLNATK